MFRCIFSFKHLLTPIAIEKVKHVLDYGLSYSIYRYVYLFGVRIMTINVTRFQVEKE